MGSQPASFAFARPCQLEFVPRNAARDPLSVSPRVLPRELAAVHLRHPETKRAICGPSAADFVVQPDVPMRDRSTALCVALLFFLLVAAALGPGYLLHPPLMDSSRYRDLLCWPFEFARSRASFPAALSGSRSGSLARAPPTGLSSVGGPVPAPHSGCFVCTLISQLSNYRLLPICFSGRPSKSRLILLEHFPRCLLVLVRCVHCRFGRRPREGDPGVPQLAK